jgi:hypothetical protein
MKNPFRHWSAMGLAWLLGFGAALFLLFALPPYGQCAPDPGCGAEAERWWHIPLLVLVALGPGITATILWYRSSDAAG